MMPRSSPGPSRRSAWRWRSARASARRPAGQARRTIWRMRWAGSAASRTGIKSLSQACDHYRLALEEYPRDVNPIGYADTQYNIALTLLEIARKTGKKQDFDATRAAIEASHSVYTEAGQTQYDAVFPEPRARRADRPRLEWTVKTGRRNCRSRNCRSELQRRSAAMSMRVHSTSSGKIAANRRRARMPSGPATSSKWRQPLAAAVAKAHEGDHPIGSNLPFAAFVGTDIGDEDRPQPSRPWLARPAPSRENRRAHRRPASAPSRSAGCSTWAWCPTTSPAPRSARRRASALVGGRGKWRNSQSQCATTQVRSAWLACSAAKSSRARSSSMVTRAGEVLPAGIAPFAERRKGDASGRRGSRPRTSPSSAAPMVSMPIPASAACVSAKPSMPWSSM